MATEDVAGLLSKINLYNSEAIKSINNYVFNDLARADLNLAIVSGYISNLSETVRDSANQYMTAAQNDLAAVATTLTYNTKAWLNLIPTVLTNALNVHLAEVEKARNSAVVDIEKLVGKIEDNTRGLLGAAVKSVVDNLYNVQDTISGLLAGGYKYLTEAFVAQFDRIPAAVWGYLDKYLFEKIS